MQPTSTQELSRSGCLTEMRSTPPIGSASSKSEAPRSFEALVVTDNPLQLDGRVFVVTGGAQGLGLTLAEALVEAGGHVYCLDVQPEPQQAFYDTQAWLQGHYQGTLQYRRVDVQNAADVDDTIASIAHDHGRLDGLVAAAGIQYVKPALEYPAPRVSHVSAYHNSSKLSFRLTGADDERQLQRRLLLGCQLYVTVTQTITAC